MHGHAVLPRLRRQPGPRRVDHLPRRPLRPAGAAASALLAILLLGLAACTSGAPPAAEDAATRAAVTMTPRPTPTARCPQTPCRGRPQTVGSFGARVAPEASGLAASRRNPGLLYILDDGPGTTSLAVVRSRTGRLAGSVTVAGLNGTDTEALAVGPCDATGGASCLYIGDIGDNLAARSSVTVTRVPEPDLSAGSPAEPVAGEQVTLTYPGGPSDAEALLVDGDGGLLVITKDAGRRGRGAARLYLAREFGDQRLRDAGRVRLPQPSLPLATAVVGNVVTGADAADGRVAVRTYDAIFEFTAPAGAQALRDFARWPVREVPAPAEPQGEAVAYGPDRCSLYTVSEDSPRLSVVPCR